MTSMVDIVVNGSARTMRHDFEGRLASGVVERRMEVLRRLADTLIHLQDGHPLRVAIDGITASGKTPLGNELATAVTERGRPVIRIRMDDFHHRREHRYRQGKDSARGYYDYAYDFVIDNDDDDPTKPRVHG